MRTTLIVGNWKMNGTSKSVNDLIEGIKSGEKGKATLVVCPPAIFLAEVGAMLETSAIAIGAQNVCDQKSGAYTGEIAASMLTDCGCRYVIVGHSERRIHYQESDELIAARFSMALESGLIPILCVGETLQQREAGVTEKVIDKQLDAVIEQSGIADLSNSVIAYEPVWAIGTGKVASVEQAQAVHGFIRRKLAALDSSVAEQVQILYGGSMNPANAGELLAQTDIDGGLIGGASLKAADFLAIAQSA